MIRWSRAARRGAGTCCLALTLLCFPALASQAAEVDLPARWQVRADGWTGFLVLKIDDAGRVSGTLQDRPVTGSLAGRLLVLHRTVDGQDEVWEGRLPENPSPPGLFVAGTMTLGGGRGERIHPWYAVPVQGAAAVPVAPAPPVPEKVPPPAPSPAVAALPSTSGAHWDAPDISGIWLSPEGPSEITQQGRSLTVVRPGGTRHEGRFTAKDTLVVGLGKGCCKGKLDPTGLLAWSDGSIWRRPE